MHLDPHLLGQVNAERQERLRAEAAAHRLAASVATRTRLALFLRRAADRLDAATSPCGHVRAALPEQG